MKGWYTIENVFSKINICLWKFFDWRPSTKVMNPQNGWTYNFTNFQPPPESFKTKCQFNVAFIGNHNIYYKEKNDDSSSSLGIGESL